MPSRPEPVYRECRVRIVSLSVFALLAVVSVTAAAQTTNDDLLAAAKKGDVASVKSLLAAGADVNAKGKFGATALSYASDRGYPEIVRILIERGADINVKDTFYNFTPLFWASYRGFEDIGKMLLQKGAAGEQDAFVSAASRGFLDFVRMVLEFGGVKPDTLPAALKAAVDGGFPEIADVLKKAGATLPPTKATPDTLKSYVGVYKGDKSEITVTLSDGKLFLAFPGQSAHPLEPTDETTFTLLDADRFTVVFRAPGKKVAGLLIQQPDKVVEYARVEGR